MSIDLPDVPNVVARDLFMPVLAYPNFEERAVTMPDVDQEFFAVDMDDKQYLIEMYSGSEGPCFFMRCLDDSENCRLYTSAAPFTEVQKSRCRDIISRVVNGALSAPPLPTQFVDVVEKICVGRFPLQDLEDLFEYSLVDVVIPIFLSRVRSGVNPRIGVTKAVMADYEDRFRNAMCSFGFFLDRYDDDANLLHFMHEEAKRLDIHSKDDDIAELREQLEKQQAAMDFIMTNPNIRTEDIFHTTRVTNGSRVSHTSTVPVEILWTLFEELSRVIPCNNYGPGDLTSVIEARARYFATERRVPGA